MTDQNQSARRTNRELCGHAGNERGYAFHNPDTGVEWSPDHPVESGQVDDAEDIRPMRFATFRRRYMECNQ